MCAIAVSINETAVFLARNSNLISCNNRKCLCELIKVILLVISTLVIELRLIYLQFKENLTTERHVNKLQMSVFTVDNKDAICAIYVL